jgi:hypothetical protein
LPGKLRDDLDAAFERVVLVEASSRRGRRQRAEKHCLNCG